MHANTLFSLGLCLLSISGIGFGFTVPEGFPTTGDMAHLDEPKMETMNTAEVLRETVPLDLEPHNRPAAAASGLRSFLRNNDPVHIPSSKALNDAVAAYRKMVVAAALTNPETVRAMEMAPLRFMDQMRPVEVAKPINQVKYMEALKQLQQPIDAVPFAAPNPLRYSSLRSVDPMDSIAFGDEAIPLGRMSNGDQGFNYHFFDDEDSFSRNFINEPRHSDYMRPDEFQMMPEDVESSRIPTEDEILRTGHDSSLEDYFQNSENQMRMEAAKTAVAAAAAQSAAAARSAATRAAVAAAARTAAAKSAAAVAAARTAAAAAIAARSARSAGVRSYSPVARSAAAAAAASRSAAVRSATAAAAA